MSRSWCLTGVHLSREIRTFRLRILSKTLSSTLFPLTPEQKAPLRYDWRGVFICARNRGLICASPFADSGVILAQNFISRGGEMKVLHLPSAAPVELVRGRCGGADAFPVPILVKARV